MDSTIDTKEKIESPYVGLRPFEREDENYFFGRKDDIEVAATNLRATNITIFYGASGVGKSSVINAGVLPYLQRMADLSTSPDEMPKFIPVMLSDWANDPIVSLHNIIEKAVAKYEVAFNKALSEADANNKEIISTKEKLGKDKNNEKDTEVFGWKNPLKIKFLIVLDQFEVFLSDKTKPEYKFGEKSFGEQLSKILNDAELPVNVMISLRDDALAQLDFLKNKVPDLMKNMLRLEHLDRSAAEETIREPLRIYNDESGTSYKIDDGDNNALVKDLLKKLEVGYKEPEAQKKKTTDNIDEVASPECSIEGDSKSEEKSEKKYQVQTPYLQLVMSRLWEETVKNSKTEITLKTLNDLCGVEGIRESYLDEVMKKNLTEAEMIKASKFIHLTVSTSGAKRSSTVEDLHFGFKDSEITNDNIKEILDKLDIEGGYKGIFKKVRNRGEDDPFKSYFYEVTHDALVPSILSWTKRENKKIEQQEKLAEEERLRLEQKAKRKAKIRITVLSGSLIAAILIILIVNIFISYNAENEKKAQNIKIKNDEAKRQDELIEKQEMKNLNEQYANLNEQYATLIPILLDLQSDNPDQAKEALRKLGEKSVNNKIPEEYKSVTDEILKDNTHPQDSQKRKEIIIKAANKANVPQPKTTPSPNVSQAIIFIQFQSEDNRPNAGKLRNLLNNSGFLAPGVENVGEINLKKIQLRYFPGKYSQETLDKVYAYLNCMFADVRKVPISGYDNSPQVRQNQFELWFTSDGIPDINQGLSSKCSTAAN